MQLHINSMINKKSKKLIKGFSLIELMVVVAIIGILSSVAVPAYDAYMVRSRMTHLITVANEAKKAISENRIVQGTFPKDIGEVYSVPASDYYTSAIANFPSSCTDAGKNQYKYVFKIPGSGKVFPENEVTVVMTGTWTVPSASTAGSLNWKCDLFFTKTGGSVANRYIPGGSCTPQSSNAIPTVECT